MVKVPRARHGHVHQAGGATHDHPVTHGVRGLADAGAREQGCAGGADAHHRALHAPRANLICVIGNCKGK